MFPKMHILFDKYTRSKSIYPILGIVSFLFVVLSIYYTVVYSPLGRAETRTVTNLNNDGVGSFRDAILNANDGDIIEFSVSGTIAITSTLTITDSITATADGNIIIDGQGTANGDACVIFDGNNGGNNITFSGFTVTKCSGSGIFVNNSSNNIIGGDITIERNVLIYNGRHIGPNFPNGKDGIYITGASAFGNTIIGNYIGLDSDGSIDGGNKRAGIMIDSNASANIIGGTSSAERNYIYGNNNSSEIYLDSAGSDNQIFGNYIGINALGDNIGKTDDYYLEINPQNQDGIFINNTDGTVIGGSSSEYRNIISGNTGRGIYIEGSPNTIIYGNYIGLNIFGNEALANENAGILISSSAAASDNVLIGGSVSGQGNVISGNNFDGIQFQTDNFGVAGIQIQGNYIGLAANGIDVITNEGIGINIENYDTILIGGAVAGAGNYISGNNNVGINLINAVGTEIYGNIIGLNINDESAGNASHGIYIDDGSTGTLIGDEDVLASNIISGNNNYGIYSGHSNTNGSIIKGNIIGLASDGSTARANSGGGIYLMSADNQIGSSNILGSNIVSGNGGDGIQITGLSALNNLIRLNSIFSNVGFGINLNNGGNGDITSPLVSSATTSTLVATKDADDNSIIDFYYADDGGEGQNYIGTALLSSGTAVLIGNFSATANVVATITDLSNTSSAFSALQTITADITDPLAPTNLAVSSSGDTSVVLDWDDNTEIDKDDYTVYRSTLTPVTQVEGNIVASGLIVSTYTDTEVINGITYYYAVSAFDTVGNESSLSNEVNARPADPNPPVAPANLSAIAADRSVALDWNDNSENDFDHYVLYRFTSSDFSILTGDVISNTLTSSSYTNTDLINGVTYYYKVLAVDVSANISLPSDEVSGTPVSSSTDDLPASNPGGGGDFDFDYDVISDDDIVPEIILSEVIEEKLLPDLYINDVYNDGSSFKVEICSDDKNTTGLEFLVEANSVSQTLRYGGTIIKNQCKIFSTWGLSYYQIYDNGEYEVFAFVDSNEQIVENDEENNTWPDAADDEKVLVDFYEEGSSADQENTDSQSNDAIEQSDVNTASTTTTTEDQSVNPSSNEDNVSVDQEQNSIDSDVIVSNTDEPIEQNDAEVEENDFEVDGIPLINTEESNALSSNDSSSGSFSTGGGEESILTNVKTNVVRTAIVEEVTECNLNYYGNEEVYNEILNVYGLSYSQALYLDIDEDELNAMEECQLLTNPLVSDTDNDGLSDGEEHYNYYTEPLMEDTDSDGYSDGLEIEYKTDSLDPDSFPSTCDLIEEFNYDTDSDGLPNYIECQIGSDPENNDTDFDGLDDASEYIDYNTNPLIKDDNLKLQITFPMYDSILSTNKPFFQCVAKEGEAVSIILQKELNGERFVLGTVISGSQNKCIYDVNESLLDGTYYVSLETNMERSLPIRFKIDTSFGSNDIFELDSLGGEKITDEVLNGDEILEIDNNNPDFVATLLESKQNNRVQLVWHSVVTGAVAIRDSAGHISARPPHKLEEGRHDLYVSVLDANNNQKSYVKIDFAVDTNNLLADFEGRNVPLYFILIFFAIFITASYYIYFKHNHSHAIYISQKDIINHVTTYIHDKILRKINYKE